MLSGVIPRSPPRPSNRLNLSVPMPAWVRPRSEALTMIVISPSAVKPLPGSARMVVVVVSAAFGFTSWNSTVSVGLTMSVGSVVICAVKYLLVAVMPAPAGLVSVHWNSGEQKLIGQVTDGGTVDRLATFRWKEIL